MQMKLLPRTEELLLLAIWRLQDDAYTVTIRELLQAMTGKTWAFGALFVSLDRLVKKGYAESYLSDPTPERGGRSKRMYRLRPPGIRALIRIREVQDRLWEGVTVRMLQGALPG